MRTTLTLDDDVARVLQKESRRSGASFKQVINHFLRLGLVAASSKHLMPKPFTVTPRKLGLPAGLTYDNIEQVLEVLEDHPAHR